MGGTYWKGKRIPKEVRLKMSISHRGKEVKDSIRKKISEKLKGNKNCEGNVLSEKHKKNISDSLKGRSFSKAHKKNLKNSWKNSGRNSGRRRGFRHSEQTKRKMREAKAEAKSCWNWKGGITPENTKIKNSIEYRLWREAVFARDNWTCQKYGVRGGKLNAHHIQNFAQYPELRFAIDNGITLSEKAHGEFHKKYGRENNTKEQLKEFLLG